MNKFTNIFKRCVFTAAVGAMTLSFAGCSKTESNSNLDFTETVIDRNTPDNGQWYIYKFKKYQTAPETVVHLRDAAKALGFDEFDSRNAVCSVFVTPNTTEDLAIGDMDGDRFNNVQYTRFCSDDYYIHIENTGSMTFNNRKSLKSVIEEAWVLDLLDSETGDYWMPQIGGAKIIKRYDVSDAEGLRDKYSLNGKEVSVGQELEYAEKLINAKQLPHLVSTFFTYKPLEIRVYQQTPANYGFYFIFRLYCDGVPLDGSSTVNIAEYGNLYASRDHIYMANDKTIDYMWTGSLYGDEPFSKEPCEIKIDYENACRIVSEKLSREHVFKLESAELIYCIDGGGVDQENNRYITVKPMWQFIITNTGMQFGTICVNVDAVSGEMFMRGVME